VGLLYQGLGQYIGRHVGCADMLNRNESLSKRITGMVIFRIYMLSPLVKPVVFNKLNSTLAISIEENRSRRRMNC